MKKKSTCKQCGSKIIELEFSEDQKLEIWESIVNDSKLFAVKKLKSEYNLPHENAKIIVAHFNKQFGECHKCGFKNLETEDVECPNCKAYNYNSKIGLSFNKEFCTHLEWKLDFKELENDKIKHFWCDGVNHFPYDIKSLSKRNVKEQKEIKTQAWIGEDGQGLYEMTIKFGQKAIANYLQDKSLIDCIPEQNYKEWISINPKRKKVRIQLK